MDRVQRVQQLEEVLLGFEDGRFKRIKGLVEFGIKGDQLRELVFGNHECSWRRFSAALR